jgi:hypothetical protein
VKPIRRAPSHATRPFARAIGSSPVAAAAAAAATTTAATAAAATATATTATATTTAAATIAVSTATAAAATATAAAPEGATAAAAAATGSATATTAATTTATASALALLGFVDVEGTAVEDGAVHLFDRLVSVCIAGEGDEAEAPAATCVAIVDNLGVLYRTERLECSTEPVVIGVPAEAAHKKLLRHVSLSRCQSGTESLATLPSVTGGR